jgi:hypothetical protein
MSQLDFLSDLDRAVGSPVWMAQMHREQFTDDFIAYLPDNEHVFEAFRDEAMKVRRMGFKHYSARTIVESLRHRSALAETGGPWKLNNDNTPYLARLFDLMHPEHAGLWEFRRVKAAEKEAA